MKNFQSRKLLAANQFIIEESRNKVAANKSWFTVYDDLSYVIHLSGHFIYLDDFPGNQRVRINEARLYAQFSLFNRVILSKNNVARVQ
jgi:hypothetical protein